MMRSLNRRQALAVATALALPAIARAETNQLRVSYGYSTGYLPLMVMREQRLIEKYAVKAGLGDIGVSWQVLDGGNNINDAMLAGALDIAGLGVPGYLVLRDRTRGRKQEVVALSSLTTGRGADGPQLRPGARHRRIEGLDGRQVAGEAFDLHRRE